MEVKLTELFGMNVFNDAKMVECLPKKIYVKLKQTIENERHSENIFRMSFTFFANQGNIVVKG